MHLTISLDTHNVVYGRSKPGMVEFVVLESSTEVWLTGVQAGPPMSRIPAGDCQATWLARPSSPRWWERSQAPVKVWQLVPVPMYCILHDFHRMVQGSSTLPVPISIPPHTVQPDTVCCRRGSGSEGMLQLWPEGRITSAE